VSNLFFGCILYTDDIILLSSSVSGLQNMLDICVTFGAHSSIMFNDKKSNCVAVGKKKMHILPSMMLGNLSLQQTNNFKYLSINFSVMGTVDVDCTNIKRKFYSSCNSIFLQHCGCF